MSKEAEEMDRKTDDGPRYLRSLVRGVIGWRVDTVWHDDSPGIRVGVRRNNLTRLWRSPDFTEVGERHLPATVHPPAPMPKNRRLYSPNAEDRHA